MKKNMLTVVILAISVVNMVLSGVIVFSVVPTSHKTSKLITQVSSVIDLELQTSKGEIAENVDPTKVKSYKIESPMTINLSKGSDGANHYGVLDSIVLSINTGSKDYKKLNETIAENQSFITDIVSSVISSYTIDNAVNQKAEMKAEIIKQIQKHFDSDFIFSVSLDTLRFQ